MSCELSCCLDVEEPGFADVTAAVLRLMGFLRDHGVNDARFLGEFELAMAEALNNAVEHGSSGAAGKFFRARLYLRPEFVELRVVDPSSFGGWSSAPKLPDDPFAEGGRGHYLMAHLTDELAHEEENGCHVLVLRKKFASRCEYVPGASERIVAEMTDELVSSYEMISTLLDLSEWLATSPEIDRFSEGALARLREVTGADFCYVRLMHGGNLELLKESGSALKPPEQLIAAAGPGTEAAVFASGRESTLLAGTALRPDDPLAGMMDSGFVTPILFKGQKRGVLVLGRRESAPFFDAGKLKIVRLLAEYLGVVVTMADLQERRLAEERAMRDLKIAAEIQLSLMPRDFASVEGLDLHGTCHPARHAGGDYFDVIVLPDNSVLCLVADVMGKGLPAALLASMLRTSLRGVVAGGTTEPGEVLTRINSLMSADLAQLEMFITVACLWISPGRDTIRHASAGHLRPQIFHASGEVAELLDGGVPVGIFAGSTYTSEEAAFTPRTRLLLYTDGLVEACAPDGSFFGDDGVRTSLQRSGGATSRAALVRLLEDVTAFTGDNAASDDRTAILVARTN